MTLFSQYGALWATIVDLPFATAIIAIVVAMLAVPVTVFLHELGHWTALKRFGVTGRIGFFVRRGESRFWWISVMGVKFDDADYLTLSRTQFRIVAACGPAVDILCCALCLTVGPHLPGPVWLAKGIALLGAIYVLISILDIVPLPIRNDGWLVWRPEAALAKIQPPIKTAL